jgi:hypothetical protein
MPITQAVGNQFDHPHGAQLRGISGASVIDVIGRLIGQQPVIGGIVDALDDNVGPSSLGPCTR